VGSHFGYFSFLLAEEGARHITAVESSQYRHDITRHIAERRALFIHAVYQPIEAYLESTTTHFDITLFLSLLHHLLKRNPTRGWKTLNTLLDRSDLMFLMVGITDPDWHVFDDWDNDVPRAVKDMTGCNSSATRGVEVRKLGKNSLIH